MGPNLLFDKMMSKIRHSQIGNLQVINSTPLGLPPLQTPQQEKVKVMGWSPTTFESDESLTARELGLALGNAWTLPVSAKIVAQLNKCMNWQPDAKGKINDWNPLSHLPEMVRGPWALGIAWAWKLGNNMLVLTAIVVYLPVSWHSHGNKIVMMNDDI